jgi:hypothetical protein
LKKILLASLLFILIATSLSACSTTTITDKPGNYLYGLNEEIKIVDIDTRETLGTVKITGVEILRNEPFDVRETDGTDESGNTKYKDVTYQQVIQVFYTYNMIDSSKSISSKNFYAHDSTNKYANFIGSLEPKPEYTEIQKEGHHSFIIATKNKGNHLNISFDYTPLQTKATAKIRVDL